MVSIAVCTAVFSLFSNAMYAVVFARNRTAPAGYAAISWSRISSAYVIAFATSIQRCGLGFPPDVGNEKS